MKRSRFLILTAIMSPAAVLIVGCSKNNSPSATADNLTAGAKNAAANAQGAASDSWNSIKDYTYARRVEFSASMDRFCEQVDNKTRELKAKLAGTPGAASEGRQAAVREYDDARADLKSSLSNLGNATADTWAGAKEKVAQSWKRVQAAYDKVMSSNAS